MRKDTSTLINACKDSPNFDMSKHNKQEIVKNVQKVYDNNDTIALILNVLEENLDSLKDSKHKEELVSMLETRKEIKKNVKGGD